LLSFLPLFIILYHYTRTLNPRTTLGWCSILTLMFLMWNFDTSICNNGNQYENHVRLWREWQSRLPRNDNQLWESWLIDARMTITIDWCENHVDLIITINMRIMIDWCENDNHVWLMQEWQSRSVDVIIMFT
jgi:hypothetical protein